MGQPRLVSISELGQEKIKIFLHGIQPELGTFVDFRNGFSVYKQNPKILNLSFKENYNLLLFFKSNAMCF